MKVAKRFRFEAAHRLPWHGSDCRHVHGHSYCVFVELEGTPDERGMLIDFKEVKHALGPLIDQWDHATLVADDDEALRQALDTLGSKHYILPFDSTAENLAQYVADYLGTHAYDTFHQHGVEMLRVRLQETDTCYAEVQRSVHIYADDYAASADVITA